MVRGSAQKFVDLVDLVGPAKALEAYSLDSTPRASNGSSTTVSEWMKHYIDLLSGVNRITVAKYEAYLKNDIGPVFGHRRLADVSRDDVARWITTLESAGVAAKTIRNKAGLLSAAGLDGSLWLAAEMSSGGGI